jgi:hypothetical protein
MLRNLKPTLEEIAPIFSMCLIVACLLGVVLMKMQERQLGYSVLKMSRQFRELSEQRKWLEIQHAKSIKLDKLQNMVARKPALRRTETQQVIYMNDELSMPVVSEARQ